MYIRWSWCRIRVGFRQRHTHRRIEGSDATYRAGQVPRAIRCRPCDSVHTAGAFLAYVWWLWRTPGCSTFNVEYE